jgi:hypothetical protein
MIVNQNSQHLQAINGRPSLLDVVRFDQSEKSRILAGCCLGNPLVVIPLIEKLNVDDIRDPDARKLISCLRQNFQAIQDAPTDTAQADLVAKISFEVGLPIEAARFAFLATDVLPNVFQGTVDLYSLPELATQAARDIMADSIAFLTFERLQQEISNDR